MRKLFLMLTATLIVGVSAAMAAAQTQNEASLSLLADTIRDNRKAFVAANLTLSGEEAAAFWPVYDRYEKDLKLAGDRIVTVVEDYSEHFRDLSNDKAMQLMEDYLAAEAERLKIRRSYLSEFAKILPGRTVARFYQLENKMDAVIRYELAAEIPVIDENSAAPAK